ncbi:hypothetical protein Hte_003837 [Hypoxylon texense]
MPINLRFTISPCRQSIAHSLERKFDLPLFIPVEDRWEYLVYIGACADKEEDNKQEGLEVEERGLVWRLVIDLALKDPWFAVPKALDVVI